MQNVIKVSYKSGGFFISIPGKPDYWLVVVSNIFTNVLHFFFSTSFYWAKGFPTSFFLKSECIVKTNNTIWQVMLLWYDYQPPINHYKIPRLLHVEACHSLLKIWRIISSTIRFFASYFSDWWHIVVQNRPMAVAKVWQVVLLVI